MDLGATLVNTFVVVAVGAVLTYVTNDRFKALRREVDALRGDFGGLRGDFGDLRVELKGDIAGLQGELKGDIARVEARLDAGIAAVRSDIVQVALAIGARRDAAQG